MRTWKLLVISLVILFTLLACALIPQGVQNLFATKTPTATATPTSTPTPTATPLPPISISPCAFEEYCPDVIYIDDLLTNPNNGENVFYIRVPFDRPVRIVTGWTTKNEDILKDNLKQMEWIFQIDGKDYFQPTWPEQGVTTFENEPGVEYPGQWFGVILEDWEIGESHTILVGFNLKQRVNDGWDDYDAGMYFKKYVLTAAKIPTATPTPTVTSTATPTLTFTPRPTAIPYTKTPKPTLAPPCNVDSYIPIENDTGGWVTINLTGPGKFSFNVAPGDSRIDVCSGSYSYTAYGCGGSSKSGSVAAGSEAITFFCQ